MQQPYECELFQNKHNSFLFRSMGYYCGSRTLKMVMLILLKPLHAYSESESKLKMGSFLFIPLAPTLPGFNPHILQ